MASPDRTDGACVVGNVAEVIAFSGLSEPAATVAAAMNAEKDPNEFIDQGLVRYFSMEEGTGFVLVSYTVRRLRRDGPRTVPADAASHAMMRAVSHDAPSLVSHDA